MLDEYIDVVKIGDGTLFKMYSAKHKTTGEFVSIRKIILPRKSFNS